MMIFWIFLLMIIVFGIWYFGNKRTLKLPRGEKKEDALDILKQRFAKGEIAKEEYEKHKAVLDDEY